MRAPNFATAPRAEERDQQTLDQETEMRPAKPPKARAAAPIAAVAASVALLAAAPLSSLDAAAQEVDKIRTVSEGPAFEWRFLKSDAALVALEPVNPEAPAPATTAFLRNMLQSAEKASARGRFVLHVPDRGVFFGLYTIREDGKSLVGAFWPEDAEPTDPIAGTLDVGAAPDGELGPNEGRVRFLAGDEYGGLRAD